MRNNLVIILLLFVLTPFWADAGGGKEVKKEHASVSLTPATIVGKAGDTVNVKLSLALDKDWHAYDMEQGERNGDKVGPNPMEINARGGSFRLGKIKAPKSHIQFDSTFEVSIGWYEGKVEFDIPVIIKPMAPAGRFIDTLAVLPQLCNDTGICTYPEFLLPLTIEVVPGSHSK